MSIITTPIKGSSAIKAIAYDPLSRTLHVTMSDDRTLTHPNVSIAQHQALLSAPSKGKAYNKMFPRKTPSAPLP